MKELLKPPFVSIGNGVIDNEGKTVVFDTGGSDEERCMRAEWITAAMNEKHQRDSWGIKRWIYVINSETDYGIICPDCGTEYSFPSKPIWSDYQYCPHCGVWLGEPEKKTASN